MCSAGHAYITLRVRMHAQYCAFLCQLIRVKRLDPPAIQLAGFLLSRHLTFEYVSALTCRNTRAYALFSQM